MGVSTSAAEFQPPGTSRAAQRAVVTKLPYDWTRKFAWLPIRLNDGWIWLRHHERRLEYNGSSAQVRLLS